MTNRIPTVLVVDYGMGNAGSVLNALSFLGAEALYGHRAADFERATHVILPGVGSFTHCMRRLHERGIIPPLEQAVRVAKKPYLGICLGMQILADTGEEGGESKGLGWVAGATRKLSAEGVRLPHVGWNDVESVKESPLLANIAHPIFYFVHSYALAPAREDAVLGKTVYGASFVSAVSLGNLYGVQFHPEKSQRAGLELLSNFLSESV